MEVSSKFPVSRKRQVVEVVQSVSSFVHAYVLCNTTPLSLVLCIYIYLLERKPGILGLIR